MQKKYITRKLTLAIPREGAERVLEAAETLVAKRALLGAECRLTLETTFVSHILYLGATGSLVQWH